MPVEGDYECYSGDWRRTNPDLVLSLPKEPTSYGEHQDHVLVDITPGGDLLAIWTLSVTESALAVVYARSTDGGVSWTEPQWIDGPRGEPGQDCSFGFPVLSKNGRIYCFYNESYGIGEGRINALLRCKYSDDDGHSWIGSDVKTRYRRTKWDHPDPAVLERCIVWQKPVRDAKGRHIVPGYAFNRLGGAPAPRRQPHGRLGPVRGVPLGVSAFREYRRRTAARGRADYLPAGRRGPGRGHHLLRAACLAGLLFLPGAGHSAAARRAPFHGDAHLERGRSGTRSRTTTGTRGGAPRSCATATAAISCSIRSRRHPCFDWTTAAICSSFRINDGWGYGGRGPLALESRRPQFMAVGEFRPDAHQPVWFSEPMLLFDTQKVGVYPLYMWWLSMYASLTEHNGKRIFWYTDRKVFSLGRYITDEMLAPLTVPS